MSIARMTQNMEIKFWNLIIPVMEEKGPLMKTIHSFKRASSAKIVNIVLLILIWAAIGFVSGMIIGRFMWILQLL